MTEKELRKAVIKLAYEHPELRPHLLPIVKEAAAEKNVPLKGDFHQAADGSLSLTITPKAGGSALATTFKRFRTGYSQRKLTMAVNDEGGLVITLTKPGAGEEAAEE